MARAQQAPEAPETQTQDIPRQPRQHKASYSRDNRNGGYLIRVEGPNAARFSKRIVPVTRLDGSESTEQLEGLIWSGVDQKSGKPVGLYHFTQKPREEVEVDF